MIIRGKNVHRKSNGQIGYSKESIKKHPNLIEEAVGYVRDIIDIHNGNLTSRGRGDPDSFYKRFKGEYKRDFVRVPVMKALGLNVPYEILEAFGEPQDAVRLEVLSRDRWFKAPPASRIAFDAITRKNLQKN